MNYILQLKSDKTDLHNQIKDAAYEVESFIRMLRTDKFIGSDLDGSRKDWISTGDAIDLLQNIRSKLYTGY